jgi:5-hydroxyisourate hydrolase-like protein (transthyretin family)
MKYKLSSPVLTEKHNFPRQGRQIRQRRREGREMTRLKKNLAEEKGRKSGGVKDRKRKKGRWRKV